MAKDTFDSSDSIRSGKPLRYAQRVELPGPVKLPSGQKLPGVRVVYETYGKLNERRDNAVLICHALTGDSHVASHNDKDDPGWWEIVVGPGKTIDTNRYFVICPNSLGGCRGTTGPNSLNPATGRPYGADFPAVTIADIVDVQRLLIDHLGIEKLLAVVGGSLGGMQVLQWAVNYPERVAAVVPIATAPVLSSQALAFDVIGRNAITQDPEFRGGQYYDVSRKPADGVFSSNVNLGGLAIARMIGHITYLSRQSMSQKFGGNRRNPRQIVSKFEKDSSVASYLAHQGDKFVERFDANSYVTISRAMDAFDLGEGKALQENLSPATCRWLIVSFSSDWLFPPDQSLAMVRALLANAQKVSYCNVRSDGGHDAFLLKDELDVYGGLLAGFLAKIHNGHGKPAEAEEDAHGQVQAPDTSIFHGRRLDYDRLERLVVEEVGGNSALDLGCGGGQLLLRLKRRSFKRLLGLEIDQQAVKACVSRGIDCIHADLNEGLDMFDDRSFDCVTLSRTLQAVRNVDRVVEDMLRVGRRCVVSFPNFGFKPLREMLYAQGKAPEAPGLLRYRWYNTPNIRFFSIADFQDYCREKGATIHRLVALNTQTRREVTGDPNLNADLAIFVMSRK